MHFDVFPVNLPSMLYFQHFRPQASGSAKMNSRSSIFKIFDPVRQDQRNWATDVRFSAFSSTGARISEIELQMLDFQHFEPMRQDQRNWPPKIRFSAVSSTGARISENDVQKLDFRHFRPQAPRSAKMNSRSSIFSIFHQRRQDQPDWAPEARFSAVSSTGARISENELLKFDFQHFRPVPPGSAKFFDPKRQE